ncbi:hypothetical protein NUU61_002284 [Penicillium alfredii]|uniref:Putative zinc-finger domain-containing protein n=1 Tax=Penicillium alfredii TaxID=1506179 RepID=A0A9W9FRD9_9EURO|nr:uncharacterized protein NUU61_002284 [Penicillium alfredii]KAJ5104937.1 hypothetical protein NUU61_002284 [Penicillium alfredii]
MTNQHPSFGGHFNYAPPWPPINLPTAAQDSRLDPNDHTSTQPPAAPPGQYLDVNLGSVHANSRISGPGNHGGRGFFLPPQFPVLGEFDPSQLPPFPFPPPPLPPVGLPMPPGSFNTPSEHANVPRSHISQSSRSPAAMRTSTTQLDPNREEGEISEEEAGMPPVPKENLSLGQRTSWKSPHATAQNPELEEGEMASTYNPPSDVSMDRDVVRHAIELQQNDAPKAMATISQPHKSTAQLRVQAQGALLSLAPHNIRYHELVAEGINPAVLKQLYEEVGIRVVTPQPQQAPAATKAAVHAPQQPIANPTPSSAVSATGATSPLPSNKQEAVPASEKDKLPQKPSLEAPQPSEHSGQAAPQSDTDKPMERKEVIARMLAAKAAKKTEPSVPKPAPTPSVGCPNSTPAVSKQSQAPTREKNKAQTELARQRIEELKKQAMFRSRQKAQASRPGNAVEQNVEIGQAPISVAPASIIQHPLPVRPPVPDSSPAAIPGLFMAGSKQGSDHEGATAPGQGVVVDPTPLPRAAQRKRPRASDFDEPLAAPKKHLSHATAPPSAAERLVIDISDDESLYWDDEEDDMDINSSQDQEPGPAIVPYPARPSLQKNHSAPSTSQAPSRAGDQEGIREKDLQIQEMHRKIAELEQKRKRKAELASGTQSPNALDDSGASSSSAGQSNPADVEPADPSASTPSLQVAPTTVASTSSVANRPDLINTFSDSSVRVLASMDLEQLDYIRSKILRMKAIESGLPGLDAEIQSSESRLSVCRAEADKLLSDITKGKEGRLYLVEELKNLSYEINGLSLEDLDELRRQAEVKEQHLAAKEESTSNQFSSDSSDMSVSDALGPTDVTSTLNPPQPAVSPAGTIAVNGASDDIEESSDISESESDQFRHDASESDGSAMDESSSSTSESDSDEDEETATLDTQAEAPSSASIAEASNKVDANASHHPHAESPPSAADDHNMEVESSGHEAERSRESSAASDAYEPPEPVADAESADSVYSPPFSPAPLGSVTDTAIPATSFGLPQSGEALTEAPQVSGSKPGLDSQVGILGSEPPSTRSETKFSPYVSPLRLFKAYRFHPNYTAEVPGGYRSLTYSHNIDPMKYLCPYELAGVCNDRSCEFQHFRDMTLSDDKILVQMGAVREGESEEEKEVYRAGLKEIINELRRDKVKDFEIVAASIAAYRRRFLQDPTRILPL